MTPKDKKMILLRQLSLESEPLGLSDLIQKLDESCKERSVRRWLEQLIGEGLVKKIGQKRGTKYLAIKGTDDVQGEISSCFSSVSLQVIQKIRRPIFERMPVSYADDWFDSYQPNVHFYLPKEVRRQLLQAGRRANGKDPAGTYAHHIFNRLLIDLSYNSSRLEGNTYSLLETERLIVHGGSPDDKLDQEKVMILNHKEAIRYLVSQSREVHRNSICTLHYLLADGLVEPKYAGKVRDHGVRIGGSTYIPLESPNHLQKQLDKIMEKAAVITDPFEQSFFLLVHISYLQAFIDVNKRTARLIANIPLIKENLVPLAFSDVTVQDYMSAMIAIYEVQNIRPLTDLYVYSYMRTCVAYDSNAKALGFDEVRVRYRQQRREVIREVIVRTLARDEMRDFIAAKVEELVSETDRQAFLEDIFEDLEQMDDSRIAGLGITSQQLAVWLRKR